MADNWGPFSEAEPSNPLRWTLRKDGRVTHCRVDPHPLGFELVIEVDHDPMLTQVHRQEVDADIHAATLQDDFIAKGWGAT